MPRFVFTHTSQTLRVAANLVHRDTGRQFFSAVVEFHTIGKHFPHHRQHIVLAEGNAQHLVAHAASGGVGHLGVLDVIPRVRKQVVVAGVIPMHVGGDHMINFVRLHAEYLQPLTHWMGDLA
jgi:hypothetical protein